MKNKAGIILGFITFIMALTACGSGTDAIESEESIYPKKSVELIAPAGAGSGSGGASGAAPVNGARILDRMGDDPQLARAIQEARRVLGSK